MIEITVTNFNPTAEPIFINEYFCHLPQIAEAIYAQMMGWC